MNSLTLEVEPRFVLGKQVKALRRQGITPVHLYGKATAPLALQVQTALLQRVVAQAGRNVPVTIGVKGTSQSHLAFVRQVQRHPVSEALLHVDFYQVPTSEVMRVEVPIYLRGEAPAIKVRGGVLLQVLHAIEVECLPLNVPAFLETDISHLDDFEKAVHVSDLRVGAEVKILAEPDSLVARVNPPRAAAEKEVEAAPAAEEEAPAAAEPAEQPQPEGR